MKIIFTILLIFNFGLTYSQANQNHTKNNYLYIEVKVKGQKLNFLFDNGVSVTSIRAKYIELNNIELISVTDAALGKKKFKLTSDDFVLKLPKEKLKFGMRLLVLEDVPEFFINNNIDGILGADIINMYDWVLDFEKGIASVLNEKKTDLSPFSLRIDKCKNDSLTITLKNPYNGEITKIPSLIDLGYSGVFSYSFPDTICSQDDLYRLSLRSSIVKFKQTVQSAVITRDMFFNKFKILNMPIIKDLSGRKATNLLGVDFLSKFEKVILFNSKNQLWLSEKKEIYFKKTSPKIFNGVVWSLLSKKTLPNQNQSKFQLGFPLPKNKWESISYNWISEIKLIKSL